MGLGRDDLLYLALLALDDVAEAARAGPVPRSIALRFLLAFVHQASGADPDRKWVFDSFWREGTSLGDRSGSAYLRRVARLTAIDSAMNGICHACGWQLTPELELQLRAHRAKLKR